MFTVQVTMASTVDAHNDTYSGSRNDTHISSRIHSALALDCDSRNPSAPVYPYYHLTTIMEHHPGGQLISIHPSIDPYCHHPQVIP